jgi:two-component system LytT family response regulator
MKYTAIIIDDEAMGAERLQLLLERYCPEITILSVCLKPQLGIDMIKQKKPSIVFLDIEMPNMSGFNVLEQLTSENFECIFTTAYDQYAITAIKHNALDYLLKPIDITELQAAVSKAKTKIDNGNTNLSQMVTKLIGSMELKNESPKFSIPVGGELLFVKADEVLYFEADSSYTHIYLDNTKTAKITTSKNLKTIEEGIINIPNMDFFFRIHNSYIINIKNVIKFNKGLYKKVIMKDGKELEVSRSKISELSDKLEIFFPKLF